MKTTKAAKAKTTKKTASKPKWPHPAIKREYEGYVNDNFVIGETMDRRFYVADDGHVVFVKNERDAYRLYNLHTLEIAIGNLGNADGNDVTGPKTGCEDICALIATRSNDLLFELVAKGAQRIPHAAWPENPYDLWARPDGNIHNWKAA